MNKKLNAQPNHSLIDGITVLQALATSEAPIGGRELARQLDLEPTRANRLLRTLAYMGFARQTTDRKYTSGPGMHVLAAQSLFASGFIKRALPELENLRRFNLTVALGVQWMDSVSYLYHALPGMASIDALGRIGIYPATRGGIGLALLSANSDEHIEELYQESEIPRFPDLKSLFKNLNQIRKDGYVLNPTSEKADQHTLAITIGNPVHSAVGVSGKIPENMKEELLAALRAVANTIETNTKS